MQEVDLILMSLVIFLPTVFALCLLFFPKGSDEYMRWWTLLGTTVTLVLSIILFIDFLHMLGENWEAPQRATLAARAAADSARAKSTQPGEDLRQSGDLLGRYPWI